MPEAASELDLHVVGPGDDAPASPAPGVAPGVRLLAVMLQDAPLVQPPAPLLAPVKSPQTESQLFDSMTRLKTFYTVFSVSL